MKTKTSISLVAFLPHQLEKEKKKKKIARSETSLSSRYWLSTALLPKCDKFKHLKTHVLSHSICGSGFWALFTCPFFQISQSCNQCVHQNQSLIKGLIWERVAPCWAKIISFFLAISHRLSLVPCHMTLSTWMLTLGQFVS